MKKQIWILLEHYNDIPHHCITDTTYFDTYRIRPVGAFYNLSMVQNHLTSSHIVSHVPLNIGNNYSNQIWLIIMKGSDINNIQIKGAYNDEALAKKNCGFFGIIYGPIPFFTTELTIRIP
jgi:hypothetical protein